MDIFLQLSQVEFQKYINVIKKITKTLYLIKLALVFKRTLIIKFLAKHTTAFVI